MTKKATGRPRGRPKGVVERKPRKLPVRTAEKVLAANPGVLPLEYMLEVMRDYREKGMHALGMVVARDAAPYIHARLATIDQSIRTDSTVTHRFVLVGAQEQATAIAWEDAAEAVVKAETASLVEGDDG